MIKNPIYYLNQAEGIFYPAFDKYLCKDEQIEIDQGEKIRLWDSLSFQGGTHYTIHWAGKVDVGSYDEFLAFLSFPRDASMKVTAIINGHPVFLTERSHGAENPVELKGSFHFQDEGEKLLTDLFLELDSPNERNVVILSWLGLSKSDCLEKIEKTIPHWNDEWDREIRKDCVGTIDKNMVLSRKEGEFLKAQVKADNKLLDFYNRNALEAMKIDHRSIIREYVPQPTGMYRFVRERDRGRVYLEGPILNLAIAGYLLDEAVYSRHAAELILALISMKWCEGPVCDMKDSKFHHVCFTEDHMLSEVTLAMGFLGGMFEDSARRRIADKIQKAWMIIKEKCREPGYRNFMNQGIVGCRGALLGAVYLQMIEGGYENEIQKIYEKHTQLVDQYLTREGHCAEGGGYFEYSFSTSIVLWHVYAKYTKQGWRQVVPKSFQKTGRYLEALMSVNDPRGSRNPINCDRGGEVMTLLLVFMTLVCDFPEGNNYLLARFTGNKVEKIQKSFDMLFFLYYKKQLELRPCYKAEKEEIAFEKSGFLSYRHGSTKLLITAERNPYTGHFHEDRGQIVLQAEGETLLPDLGTVEYGDSRSLLMSTQSYHNLAYPEGLTMQPESTAGKKAAAAAAYPITEELTIDDMKIPEARILFHEVTEDAYIFGVETGILFGNSIEGRREGKLKENSLLLKDVWKFPEARSLNVNFISYHPWEIKEDGKKINSGNMTLVVDSSSPAWFEVENGMVDHAGKSVYLVRIRTEKAVEQKVESCIVWGKKELSDKNSGEENRRILQEMLDRGGTIRIEKKGVYEIENSLYIKSHSHLYFGKGVVMKRSKTSVGSFFLVNRGAFTRKWDEDITIEGLNLVTNGVEARENAAVYGLTGEISLFCIKNLQIFDFTCMDLPPLSFGLHVCTFEDIRLENLNIQGRKDAVHLGTGKRFVIRHGIFRTFDDPVALNAHDYAVANPQLGWIEDGLIEDCFDLPDKETTGYFCRILAGSWCDWYKGMEIQNSDTVVSNGRIYRAFQQPDGKKYMSVTPPSHKAGMEILDGIHWVMVQEGSIYNCGCRNIHFKDIHLQKEREVALSIHFDHDRYSRSVYPGSEMPVQENIIFENLIVQNKVGCLLRSITPINTVKFYNSVIGTPKNGNSRIRLETLEGQAGAYGKSRLLLIGNTCFGEEFPIVECEEGREYEQMGYGNLVLEEKKEG